MFATWLNNHTFRVDVNMQADTLSAGDERNPLTGQPYAVKWLPCTHCGLLHKVRHDVVAFFCNDLCEQRYAEANPQPLF